MIRLNEVKKSAYNKNVGRPERDLELNEYSIICQLKVLFELLLKEPVISKCTYSPSVLYTELLM